MSAIQMAVLLMINGSAAPFSFTPTISADTSNYNLRSAALAAGWDGVAPLNATVTINSGIVVSANATSQYAFDTDASFPAGSTLAIVNNGYILGMGGQGGWRAATGANGEAGGPALRAQAAVTVTNNGTIGGGGGGGGAGMVEDYEGERIGGGGGGGGRTGRTNSSGGAAYGAGLPGNNGGAGTFSAAGGGGFGGYTYAGVYGANGGAGGGWGASGSNGQTYAPPGAVVYAAGTGGAAGAAVVGNSNITWAATGTRLGSIT